MVVDFDTLFFIPCVLGSKIEIPKHKKWYRISYTAGSVANVQLDCDVLQIRS